MIKEQTVFLVWFDNEKEAMVLHEIRAAGVDIEIPERSYPVSLGKFIEKYEPEKNYVATFRFPATNKKGEGNFAVNYLTRKRAMIPVPEEPDLRYPGGKFIESRKNYLLRERKAIEKIIKRKRD